MATSFCEEDQLKVRHNKSYKYCSIYLAKVPSFGKDFSMLKVCMVKICLSNCEGLTADKAGIGHTIYIG